MKRFILMLLAVVLIGSVGMAYEYESVVVDVSSISPKGWDFAANMLPASLLVVSSDNYITLIKELDISATQPVSLSSQVVTLWDYLIGSTISSTTVTPIWQVVFFSTQSYSTIYSKTFSAADRGCLKADRGLYINKSNAFGDVRASIQYR